MLAADLADVRNRLEVLDTLTLDRKGHERNLQACALAVLMVGLVEATSTPFAPHPAISSPSRKKAPGSLKNATQRHNDRDPTCKSLSFQMVEGKGFEPSTSALRTPRSPN